METIALLTLLFLAGLGFVFRRELGGLVLYSKRAAVREFVTMNKVPYSPVPVRREVVTIPDPDHRIAELLAAIWDGERCVWYRTGRRFLPARVVDIRACGLVLAQGYRLFTQPLTQVFLRQ